jgi:hypothetical protein
MTDEKPDYLADMIKAYDEEWMLWSCTPAKPGVPRTLFKVTRDKKTILLGELTAMENERERLSQRAAMRAAIRSLTDCPLEIMGIDEEDEIEMTDDPFWTIDFWMEPGRDIEFTIQAQTGKEALIKAITKLMLRDGELFHSIHVGRPSKERWPHTPAVAITDAPFSAIGPLVLSLIALLEDNKTETAKEALRVWYHGIEQKEMSEQKMTDEEDMDEIEFPSSSVTTKTRYVNLEAVLDCHKETKETLTRIEAKIDRILAHLDEKA